MRFIPTREHGVIDYLVGVLLIFAPSIFGFQNGGPEDRIPVVLGVITILYSLFTRYELGLFKVIPFKTHLALDFVSGVFLAISLGIRFRGACIGTPRPGRCLGNRSSADDTSDSCRRDASHVGKNSRVIGHAVIILSSRKDETQPDSTASGCLARQPECGRACSDACPLFTSTA